MRVLVLGCGPAGLIATHAAAELGAEVIVLSKARKSYMRGAQYLHTHIPGTPDDRFEIDYRLIGSADGYRSKVYGPESAVEVSPESLAGKAPAWDIRSAYDHLWAAYGGAVVPWEASPHNLVSIRRFYRPDLVISTIPAKLLCYRNHDFRAERVWVSDKALHLQEDNVVLCSGLPYHTWYRQSRIHGWTNTEYPLNTPGIYRDSEGFWEVSKPISTNCDCFDSVLRMGRYGNWTKGVLSHEAYEQTQKAVQR